MNRKRRTYHADRGAPVPNPWGQNPNSKHIGTAILYENPSQPLPIDLVVSKGEELDLSDKLTDLHYRYFGRPKDTPVVPASLGLSGFPEVKKLFRLYETARNTRRTKRAFDGIAVHLSALLGVSKGIA